MHQNVPICTNMQQILADNHGKLDCTLSPSGVCTSLTFKNVLALVHYADKIGLTAVQQVHVYIHFYEVQLVQSFSEAVFYLRDTSEH